MGHILSLNNEKYSFQGCTVSLIMTMLIRQRAADRCFHERSCFVWHPAITGSLFRKDPSVGLEGMLPENQVNIFIFCYSLSIRKMSGKWDAKAFISGVAAYRSACFQVHLPYI